MRVIVVAHAVIQPDAMVIELLGATVTSIAMLGEFLNTTLTFLTVVVVVVICMERFTVCKFKRLEMQSYLLYFRAY